MIAPLLGDRFVLRDGRNGDAAAAIALVAAAYADYPGCVLDVETEEPGLSAPADHFRARGGRFWIAEYPGPHPFFIGGMVACAPTRHPDTLELFKLYTDRRARGIGLGARLVGLVEDEARQRGMTAVELWTDTRFTAAHRLYERLGYRRGPMPRTLPDLSHTVEFHYRKTL